MAKKKPQKKKAGKQAASTQRRKKEVVGRKRPQPARAKRERNKSGKGDKPVEVLDGDTRKELIAWLKQQGYWKALLAVVVLLVVLFVLYTAKGLVEAAVIGKGTAASGLLRASGFVQTQPALVGCDRLISPVQGRWR